VLVQWLESTYLFYFSVQLDTRAAYDHILRSYRHVLQQRVYAYTRFLVKDTPMRPPTYTTQDDIEGLQEKERAELAHRHQLNKNINRMLLFPVVYIFLGLVE
jgi:hypothetical protein